MKKLFLFIAVLFFITTCKSQTQNWSAPNGWVDVRLFGAVGDSSTDNTTAFRAAAASFGINGGVLYIGPGKWVVNDSIVIPANVIVKGSGGNCSNDNTLTTFAATSILCRSSTHSVFVTTTNLGKSGVQFLDFALINQSGSTPTNGAGIVIKNGGDYRIEGVTISGFYIDVLSTDAFFWNIHWSYFWNPVYAGLEIYNTFSGDIGDFSISDCEFASGGTFTHPLAGLYWTGSGGLKLMNCKFVIGSGDTSKSFYNDVYLNSLIGTATDVIISNTSMEGFDSSGIFINAPGSNSIRHIQLSNIQTEVFVAPYAPAIRINSATPYAISNVVVDNITSYANTTSSQPAVKLSGLQYLSVGQIVGRNYSAPVSYYNCVKSNYAYQIPVDNLPNVNIWSNGALNIISDSLMQSGGHDPIIFSQGGYGVAGGLTSEKMRIDSLGHILIGTAGARETGGGRYVIQEIRKDTAVQFASFLINTSSAAGAAVQQGFDNGTYYGFASLWGPNFAGYNAISANTLGFYNPYAGVYLQADAGDITFGNSSALQVDFNSANRYLFGNGNTDNATAKMQITSTTAQQAWHYNNSTYTTATTNSDGTFSLSPTGVTTKLKATTTSGASLNIPSGTAPTTPNNGDIWYNSSSNNLESKINGITLRNGAVVGQTTLSSGTKAITITGIGTGSYGFMQLVTPNTASSTVQYKVVCTSNTVTITALVAAGTINASDASVVNYMVYP